MSDEIPRCIDCGLREQVHREKSKGSVGNKYLPGLRKKVELDGWSCYNCANYWPISK